MAVKHIPCSPFVNHSEEHATEYIKYRLQHWSNDRDWVILSNYSSSANRQYLSDEIDLVVVGPPGIRVIEVKHWNSSAFKGQGEPRLESEADKLNAKTKRLKGAISRNCEFDLGFVEGRFLFTKGENEKFLDGNSRRRVRGVSVYGLSEWEELLDVRKAPVLSNQQIKLVSKALEPGALSTTDLQTFNDSFFDLQPIPTFGEPFRRVFKARRKEFRDKVLLHLYDLTASREPNALEIAKRESDVLQRLQKSKWVPNFMDSFQEASRYPGEIFFFSYVDTESQTFLQRAVEADWTLVERLYATFQSLSALDEMHSETGSDEEPILHRNITPESLHIRSNNEPLLTQFYLGKIPGTNTVANIAPKDLGKWSEFFAPEVRQNGVGASSAASDVFSLCVSLKTAFEGFEGEEQAAADEVRNILDLGTCANPAQRASLEEISGQLQLLVQAPEPNTQPGDLPAKYWDEDTIQELNGRHYKMITRLGEGGFGITFKAMEIDRDTEEDLSGPYVIKVVTEEHVGQEAARAYARVRGQAGTGHLGGVLEVANPWRPNSITAVLKWVEGQPLDEVAGELPRYFESRGLEFDEDVLLSWARDLCEALTQLHSFQMIHGDVSPRNIIVRGGSVTLIDFDTAGLAGVTPLGRTLPYCSPEVANNNPVEFSDDLYALAATIFYSLFNRTPFEYDGSTMKERGLAWGIGEREQWPRFAAFCDRATATDRSQRYSSAMDAINSLIIRTPDAPALGADEIMAGDEVFRTDNIVTWLSQLLQSYPGSPKGNAETRGLDSDFARLTYVPTGLDEVIYNEIRDRAVSLVVLCGNAGDGKTAFLQNLAQGLGLDVGTSAERLWNQTVFGDLQIYANLDGSASYQGRSANELLNECFGPFMQGGFPENRVHLLAINDGKLLEWLDDAPDTPLAEQLYNALSGNESSLHRRIRFVDLNKRSLVGGYGRGGEPISAVFVNRLLDRMVQPDQDVWKPCHTCTAQPRCHAWASVHALRDSDRSGILRQKLGRALIAVHQRGETHITARGLRAALVYIFFGTDECADLHADPAYVPAKFYDRAFNFFSPHRQGDMLNELSKLDPALDSHPQIDAYLLKEQASDDLFANDLRAVSLDSLRRRAYFLRSDEELSRISDNAETIGLTTAKHLSEFIAVGNGTDDDRYRICSDLCEGIARLEDLPEEAFMLDNASVPLKITPRTPTETAFWVAKPRERFTLVPQKIAPIEGIETLHTHVLLQYRFVNGHVEELTIGAELFNLLMELRNGLQIADAQSDDIFANLSIFKQRLAQEDDRQLFAWNPASEKVMKIEASLLEEKQALVLTPVEYGRAA